MFSKAKAKKKQTRKKKKKKNCNKWDHSRSQSSPLPSSTTVLWKRSQIPEIHYNAPTTLAIIITSSLILIGRRDPGELKTRLTINATRSPLETPHLGIRRYLEYHTTLSVLSCVLLALSPSLPPRQRKSYFCCGRVVRRLRKNDRERKGLPSASHKGHTAREKMTRR